MSNYSPVVDPSLDYQFLLVTHMVCADQQIHSEESKTLHELAVEVQIGERTIAEMEKILGQEDDQLSVEEIAKQILPGQQQEAMNQILALAYVDGFCSVLERKMAQQVAQLWNWPEGEVQKQLIEAGAFSDTHSIIGSEKQELSMGARLLKKAGTFLSQSLIDNLAKFVGKTEKVEQLRQEILLSGPEYDQAIRQCAAIAEEDYKYADLALVKTGSALKGLQNNIKLAVQSIEDKRTGKAQANLTTQEVVKQLKATEEALSGQIIQQLESIQDSLRSKKQALNYFSIAFMGRTKAGKTTLHAIITNDGWNAIGVGKQRTTRFNRIYEWKNIRIIDTPGIGAPGGKSDEEITESIIDESDIICYVVTDDSIQESEFHFLRLLKEKAKPLIILLNVHKNFKDSKRGPYELDKFLKDPNKLFALEGQSGLRGHIDRIQRYAQEYYANDYFDIIPVMLLAAQMSREPEHQHHQDQLFQASKIQNFLDSIRSSLMKHGKIRRSQTLLGSTVGSIDNPNLTTAEQAPLQWVQEQSKIYHQLSETLKSKQGGISNKVQKTQKDTQAFLVQQIETIFQDVINAVPTFAENHWQSNELELTLGWEKTLNSLQFEQRLRGSYEESSKTFNKEVQEILEEVGRELELVLQLGRYKFSFKAQDSINFRKIFTISGGILGIASVILFFVAPPIAPVVGIVAGLASFAKNFFKSKEQKRREAVQKISEKLYTELNQEKRKCLKQADDDFIQSSQSIITEIEVYFNDLIKGLDDIAKHLDKANNELKDNSKWLNRGYAKRIIDWLNDRDEELNDQNINNSIKKVERNFGQKIFIQTKVKISINKSSEELKMVLQEDLIINEPKIS